VTLEEALDAMFKKNGLGYIVISKKNNAYDGSVQIKQGKERGSPLKDK
jgi:autotransporter-associated beta strand protein